MTDITEKNEKKVLVKVHHAYRQIVAVCDSEIIGKKFEQGNMQIDVTEEFFKGDEMPESKAIKFLQDKADDDACFNIVGKNSVEIAVKAGIIEKDRYITIQKVPIVMALV